MASTQKRLLVPNGGTQATGQRSVRQPEPGSDPNRKQEVTSTLDSLDTLTAQPQSPLPEADYDKLLVSGKNYLTCSNVLLFLGIFGGKRHVCIHTPVAVHLLCRPVVSSAA